MENKNLTSSKLTHTNNKKLVLSLIKKLNNLNYVSADSVPDIELYMDQLTTFLDKNIEKSGKDDDKALTKTMINNYTKSKLIPPPYKKKYSKDHVLLLTFIYYYKNIISLSESKTLFAPLTKRYFKNIDGLKMEEIYDEIQTLQKDGFRELQRDLFRKSKKAEKSFENASDEEREYLTLFTFVCELAFDVYVKKYMIEQICELLDESEIS